MSGKGGVRDLWCDLSVRFDTTLVSGEPPPLPSGGGRAGRALQAVLERDGLDDAGTPTGRRHGVALRRLCRAGGGAGDRSARAIGGAPAKWCRSTPGGTSSRSRGSTGRGGAAVHVGVRPWSRWTLSAGHEREQAQFAPAQFFAMSEDEKLARPSFESYEAGSCGGAASRVQAGVGMSCVAASVAYDETTGSTALAASVPTAGRGHLCTCMSAAQLRAAQRRPAQRRGRRCGVRGAAASATPGDRRPVDDRARRRTGPSVLAGSRPETVAVAPGRSGPGASTIAPSPPSIRGGAASSCVPARENAA